MLVMPFGPLLGWKRGDILAAAQRLLAAALLAAVAIAAAFALERGGPVLAPFGVGIAIFVMMGAVTDIAERTMIMRIPPGAALRRAIGLPRSAWGTAFAHFGIGVTLLGIIGVTAWGSERIVEVKPGETIELAHYRVTFDGVFSRPGSNYSDVVGRFTVHRSGELIGTMEPTRRSFPARNETTTEAALMSRGASQLYLSLGDPNPDGSVPVRLYYKPHVLMIWLGALFMFFGGGLSLSDRRLRVGAPRPARNRLSAAAAGKSAGGIEIMRRLLKISLQAVAVLAVLFVTSPSRAVEPDEMLSNPVLEARARALSQDLRCMVCQNELIDESMRRWRTTCAFWYASGFKPATAMRRCSISWSPATASSSCSNRGCPGIPRRCGACRPA